MSASRNAIAERARAYVGAPFAHQGRRRDTGIDCLGLLTCVAYDLRLLDVRIADYDRYPNPEQLRARVREYLDLITFDALGPGDVLTFAIVGQEQHFGICCEVDRRFVHAYEPAGRCVETALDSVWLRRLRGCYRFPGALRAPEAR